MLIYFVINIDSNITDNIVEGDILLTPEQMALFKGKGWAGLTESEAWEPAIRRWPTTIPYAIDSDVGELLQARSLHA